MSSAATARDGATASGRARPAENATPSAFTGSCPRNGARTARPTVSTHCAELTVYNSFDSPLGSPDAVSVRLARIEAILEQQGQQLNSLTQGAGQSSVAFPHQALPSAPGYTPPAAESFRSFLDTEGLPPNDSAQFLIPSGHTTSLSSLLAMAQARHLVGDYDQDFFFEIESRQPLPPQLDLLHVSQPSWPPLNPSTISSLAENYFAVVHPHLPLFSKQSYRAWEATIYENGPSEFLESAICYSVWALGALVSRDAGTLSPEEQAERDSLALTFFQPALRLTLYHSIWAFKSSLDICQALLLVASYFSYTGRPLHNAKMVSLAARHFFVLLEE